MCHRAEKRAAMLGAQSAQPIAASGRMTAFNRPDTCRLQTLCQTRRKLLAQRGPSIHVTKVMDRCAAAPNITVPQAFRQALGRRG